MANLGLVEVTLEGHDFSFYVVDLPSDHVEDKLALASSNTTICHIEYQNFIFHELLVNTERLFVFLIDATGGDPEYQIRLRDQVEEKIYEVNPELHPDNLVLTKSGVIKPSSKADGTILSKTSDWGRRSPNINPYVIVDEFEIIDDPGDTNEPIPPPKNNEDIFPGKFETVVKKWDRTGIDLEIRKFSKEDLPQMFGPEVSFSEETHYKIFVIQKCIEKSESVFALCDAMGLTDSVTIPVLADELYQLCVEVNPFLKAEEVDLDDIRSKAPKRGRKRKKGEAPKTKPGSGKKFSDVTRKELLSLSERMKKKIIGQDEPIDKIVDTIQIASCGLRDPDKPIATYLMCGTTGIGKTLTAKVLAEELCGSKNNMVRVDCSEYTQQHDVQKLIGAPPSYVGYEDGGFLTNAVQENPFSVVLFDEIEKAHNKLFDLLLQIMDDARLTDGKGNVTNFRDTIVLMTSNIGVSETEEVKSTMGFGDEALLTEDKKDQALKKALKNKFRPEFLNRVDETLSFRSLSRDDALKVIDLLLDKVQGHLNEKQIVAEFTDAVRHMIFDKGFSKKYGARPLERTIDKEVIRVLAKKILLEEIEPNGKVKVDYKDGKIQTKELKPRVTRKKSKTTAVKA